MKPFFKFCIPKILFLLLITNTGIRPASVMVPVVIGTGGVEILVAAGAFVIHEVLTQYRLDKSKNKPLRITFPGERIPIQIVEVEGKSNKEVVAEVTQATARALSIQNELSEVDQKKLYKKLCLQKEQLANTMVDNRSVRRIEQQSIVHRFMIKSFQIENKTYAQMSLNRKKDIFIIKNIIVRLPENLPKFVKDIQNIERTIVNCNNPNLFRRIAARIQLAYLVEFDPDLFGDIREVACNLQARYFDKNNRLIDISYDRRLAETMWILLGDSPFYWGEKELKKFVGVIKRDNLDLEDSFERLYRRVSGQLSAEEEWQNKAYKPIAKVGSGKWIIHDRHKEILNESYNGKLYNIAVLCERGQFEEAQAIVKRFNEDPMMKRVINDYQKEVGHERIFGKVGNLLKTRRNERLQAEAIARKKDERKEAELKTAAASDSQRTEQSISGPAPLPPEQNDQNKDKQQKQDSEQAKKKECPVPPPGKNKFLKDRSQQGHRWDDRPGHVKETPENKKIIYDMANDPNCYRGPDDYGTHWYSKMLEDGKQIWAEVRGNQIRNCGINEPSTIRIYNPKTGLKALKASRGKSWKPNS